jgi:hypothetical protein
VTAVKRTAILRIRPRRQNVRTPKKKPSLLIGSPGNRGGPGVKKIWKRKRMKRKVVQIQRSRKNCLIVSLERKRRHNNIPESRTSHEIFD